MRCLICGDVLGYHREETGPLLTHLRNQHPMYGLGRLDTLQSGRTTPNCDPEDCRRIYRDKLSRGPVQQPDARCDPAECERLYRERLDELCDPAECESDFLGDGLNRESDKKLKKGNVGCKPYCRVFDASEKSYPE